MGVYGDYGNAADLEIARLKSDLNHFTAMYEDWALLGRIDSLPGMLPGYTQVLSEDFNIDCPTGKIRTYYPVFRAYNEGEGGGKYWADKSLSVHNSCLDMWLYREGTDTSGFNVSAAGSWNLNLPSTPFFTYGRVSARHKYVGPTGKGWGGVLFLMPQGVWKDGELDYPEGPFGESFSINQHEMVKDPKYLYFQKKNVTHWDEWHVTTIDWRPEAITYFVDGIEIAKVTEPTQIPSTPHKWVLQAGWDLGGAATNEGNLLVDWVAAWTLDR